MKGVGWQRTAMLLGLFLVPVLLCGASSSDDNQGWSFSERFQGTSNAAGLVLKETPSVGYRFNVHAQLYGGLPVFFTRPSADTATSGNPTFVSGIGNAFTGLLISVNKDSFRYSSDLVATAPTGDKILGFSTGHATVDWTNTFSHPFSQFTPYGSIGAANTVSDTEFFIRPFTTTGVVFHFEGGALMKVVGRLNAGASAYEIRGSGDQEIVSKVVKANTSASSTAGTSAITSSLPPQSNGVSSAVKSVLTSAGVGNGSGNGNAVFETSHETTTTAAVVDDHGFSTWLSLKANDKTDFQVGYSRSASYQLNSLFFGVGFHAGH